MARQEDKNKAAVKELLEGLSDGEVCTLCIDALRSWRRKHPDDGQFSVHDALGREVVPLLLARQGRAALDRETVNGLKEPFITEQTQPGFVAVSDFLGWFIRTGYGDAISWEKHNIIGVRLTRLGMRFLDATETPSIEHQAAAVEHADAALASAKYECLEPLGEGVYGEAWRGRDRELRRDVAIKFVRSTRATRQDVLEQARAIARVTNASIIAVYEVTKVLDPKTNTVLDAVVMELAEGVSLVERLGTDLNRADASRIGTAILDAVSAYHSRGLVHLDLHDGNVIVGEQCVKVIDPMYFETTAMRSSKTRETHQQRELRRARDILIDLLHVAGVQPHDVARFEREVAKPDIELLRREFRAALDNHSTGTAAPLEDAPGGLIAAEVNGAEAVGLVVGKRSDRRAGSETDTGRSVRDSDLAKWSREFESKVSSSAAVPLQSLEREYMPKIGSRRPPSLDVQESGSDNYGPWVAFEVNGVRQRMRWIPAGTFLMGAPEGEGFSWERPQREVTLRKGYWLGETPVTQALWVAVIGKNPSRFVTRRRAGLERPVERVDWADCQTFSEQANKRVADILLRLPTETEWERACRGGTTGSTWLGDRVGDAEIRALDSIAWYKNNGKGVTHPVSRKAANPYGLYDMLGNVWEWCTDVDYDSGRQVCRGGAYDLPYVHVAQRFAYVRHRRSSSLGFRLAGD